MPATGFDSETVPLSLRWAHPLVQEWFTRKLGAPSEPQEAGWPHILDDRTTLISAPTGSGKTLAAFLACIDRLVRKALAGELHNRTEVLYVSPLKALGNDIQKNLEGPLSEIQALAGQKGLLMPTIRAAVRTGDTLASERLAMLKKPPHILVTTPESLYILLTAGKSREVLRDVETIIVDEIHAVADDKRGAHLALSLERLEHLAHRKPVRIGLSATQKPIEAVAGFLTGNGRERAHIVDVGHSRKLDLAVEVPNTELGPVASNEMWDEIYDRLAELGNQHRSTLVFVNTRRLAERVSHHLAERIGEENVAAHHGSLARKLRLQAERKLKNGEVRVLVATASLELGIDIGTVDLVCQLGSPRAIAVALQRIGRAGHSVPKEGEPPIVPKGRIFATTRDELVECAALVRAIRQHDLDRLVIPEAPLDILAQQIVACCAAEEWSEEELYRVLTRAYPYRDLSRRDFERVLVMLAEGIAARRRGRYGAYLYRDQVNGRVKARRGARLAAITSGGAIPETALFTVVAMPEGAVVGTVDEDFATESNAGDIMLLGNTSWRIRRIEGSSGRVLVEDAHGAPPSIPFWLGEAPARTAELSAHVAELRQAVSERTGHATPLRHEALDSARESKAQGSKKLPQLVAADGKQPSSTTRAIRGVELTRETVNAVAWLKDECGLDDSGAEQIIEYIVAGRAVLGDVPTQRTIIAERFFDESGGMQLIIHAPFGGRVNKAWGLALRKRFCRSFNFELQAAATDDGLNIALAEQHSFPLADVFNFLQPESVQDVLEQAVLTGSPIFATRWRWDANRSLALLRFQGGKKVPPQIQRMRSDDLLASVFPDVAACGENIDGDIKLPHHPLVEEVMKDVLHEAMDVEGLKRVLNDISTGHIRCVAVDTPVPSQFSHEILNANPYAYLDDAPLEERRARAVQMRRTLPESVLQEVGKLEPAAIAQVQEEALPDVRDGDDLHDLLQTMVILPERIPLPNWDALPDVWRAFYARLEGSRRAVTAHVAGRSYWVASEKVAAFGALFPDAAFAPEPPDFGTHSQQTRDDVIAVALSGWLTHTGPITARELASVFGLPDAEIDSALLRKEATGAVLRGHYREPAEGATPHAGAPIPNELEWCERRLLARIHRLTLGTLRKQIEPVTPAQFMRWLLRWQHVAPGTQLGGERGALEILRQLQGFEIPANAWERQVLARRVREYDPEVLDQLCLTGAVGWGRLSPHPATVHANENAPGDGAEARTRRVVPTSVAPITLFLREDSEWMAPRAHGEDAEQENGLSAVAREVLGFLRRRGASFFTDIVRGTGKLKSEVETGLWELVAAGFVTADGFDNLRALIDPKRRAGQGHGRTSRPRHSSGRWSLLYAESADHARRVEATCWMLLKRYGVVFRELLAREANLPKWRELQIAFRRLEDRGEIRGGRFISGFIGEQFALPVAVESVREMKRIEPSGETITISAADPLNLVGVVVPGERVPAISGKTVTFRDGVAYEADEERAFALRDVATM
ncbi:MAG TPA: DEAD/DEAH box helicase [Clostridia bacterium]|nr:DEAD/DEAH box helicase [Clostridia bacterium]